MIDYKQALKKEKKSLVNPPHPPQKKIKLGQNIVGRYLTFTDATFTGGQIKQLALRHCDQGDGGRGSISDAQLTAG